MSVEDFLKELEEALDTQESLTPETILDEIDEYDSIGVLSIMSLLDEMGIKVSPSDFEKLNSVADIITLAKEAIDE